MALNTVSVLMIDEKFLSDPLPQGLDTDSVNTWNDALARHHALVKGVQAEEDRILKDRNASDEGKRIKLAALAQTSVEAFAWLGKMRQQADAAKDRLEKLSFGALTQKPTGNEVVTYHREKEVRDSVGNGDAGHLAGVFLKALETDNLETARAILDWPGGSPISADLLARGKADYAKRTNPGVWARLQSVEVLKDHLATLANATSQWLTSFGVDPKNVTKAMALNN